MKKRPFMIVMITTGGILFSGCDAGGRGVAEAPRLETQTFRLSTLRAGEVASLIDPYVYGDRDTNPGTYSTMDGAVTVRETRDNLDRIARVLSEFDVARPDVRLHFQLIEADGFTGTDARIAEVEAELREIFQFRGYRLAGEATVTAADMAGVAQELRTPDATYQITGQIFSIGSDVTRLEDVSLMSGNALHLATSVNVRAGQTIVLGSSSKQDSSATLFLVVRAETGDGVD